LGGPMRLPFGPDSGSGQNHASHHCPLVNIQPAASLINHLHRTHCSHPQFSATPTSKPVVSLVVGGTTEGGVRLFRDSALRASLVGATINGASGHPSQTVMRARSTRLSPTLLPPVRPIGSITRGSQRPQLFSLHAGGPQGHAKLL